jgi:hypothetical protein
MDLGYPIHSVEMSSGSDTDAPSLTVVKDGESVDLAVLSFLERVLDPQSEDDNCVKCLSRNEGVS